MSRNRTIYGLPDFGPTFFEDIDLSGAFFLSRGAFAAIYLSLSARPFFKTRATSSDEIFSCLIQAPARPWMRNTRFLE